MTTSNANYEGTRLIRINRTAPAPSVLSHSTAKERYSYPEVIQALLQIQYQKCCYCEVYIAESGSGKQVEHFRPRSQFAELEYEWTNLLLACADCNSAKSNKFPVSGAGEPLMLDPSDPAVDPEDHIEFVVRGKPVSGTDGTGRLPAGLAVPRNGSPRGRETIQAIKLSGSQHVKRRNETLDKLHLYYSRLLAENKRATLGNGDTQQIEWLKNEIRRVIASDSTYAGLARTFVREHRVSIFGIYAQS